MTYKGGWKELLLFSLGVMWDMRRTWGLNNKPVLWKALWWVKLYGKVMKEGSPQSRSHQDGVATLSWD